MTKSYAVLGLGGFGMNVARTLAEAGMEVLAIDSNIENVNEIANDVTYAVQMDVTNEQALRSLELEKFDGAVVAIGEDLESTVMATILLKEIGVPYVVAKAEKKIHKTILEKIGADKVVQPEREMGIRLGKRLVEKGRD